MACLGVSVYLTKLAIATMMRQAAALAAGSTFVMTFLVPPELMEPEIRQAFAMADKGARESGTPFISFFAPNEMVRLAREAGFKEAQHVSGEDLAQRYFASRTDGLRPPKHAEDLLAART